MKESGKLFAVPTYFFIVNMVVLLGVGVVKALHRRPPAGRPRRTRRAGARSARTRQRACSWAPSLFVVLHAFASGGAAVTGVEAISNGVPAFQKPEWKNARQTLVIMGSLLGVMFLGLSILAAQDARRCRTTNGTPTVISQIGKLVYGERPLGHVLFYCLQAGTMLILVLAANTSFADFPRLASFHAGDNFMPRQLTKRGHRLVFSNGIIFLAGRGDRRCCSPPTPRSTG